MAFPFFSFSNARILARASAEAYLAIRENDPSRSGFHSTETDTQGLIIRSETDVIVAFRGTAHLRNWLTDMDCQLADAGPFKAHRGFLMALESVFDEVSEELAKAGGRRVWMTGHSLGGALAMLCARFWRGPVAGVYTFGQPRAGGTGFRDNYNLHLGPVSFRLVHADDIVARVPWLPGLYCHAGHEVFFPSPRIAKGTVSRSRPMCFLDAPWWRKFPWDARSLAREAWYGREVLLGDHHIASYLRLLGADSESQVSQLNS